METFDQDILGDRPLFLSAKKKTGFAGDVLKLASGTALAQALIVLAAPFLMRLYSPETFGFLALFTSISSLLIGIACMRYELAIMLPESEKEAANLLGVSLVFVMLISVLTIPAIWLGQGLLLRWLKAPNLAPYLWLIPPAVFIGGVFSALNFWNSRSKKFGRLSIARVTSSAATVSVQLGAGYAGYATGGSLICASVAGQAVSTAVLGGQIWADDNKFLVKSIRWKDMLSGLKRHRKFPIYNVWAVLLNNISWQLPAFLLAAFFSPVVVGYYALGFRILNMPMNLIGSAIGQVFFQRAAEAKKQGVLASLVEKSFSRLVMLGLFPMLILTIIGRDLYVVIFGQSWAEAGVYTQIISVWAFFWFISTPLSFLYNVLEKQEFVFKLNVALVISRFASLAIGGYLGNARLALLLFAVTGVLVYGYLSLSTMMFAGLSWAKGINIILKEFLFFLPFGLIQIITVIISPSIWVRLSVAVFLSMVYFIIVFKVRFKLNISF